MKVLSLSSGNRLDGEMSPIVKAQNRSLQQAGVDIKTYKVVGKGILGYLKNVFPLCKYLQKNEVDLIHAHYSLCGFVGYFATLLLRLGHKKRLPLIVSLMGDDVKDSKAWNMVVRVFVRLCWSATIVKSEEMKRVLGIPSLYVIPNGVDPSVFHPMDKAACKSALGWEEEKHILFGSSPDRQGKNYPLAKKAFSMLSIDSCELKYLSNIKHREIPVYLNACDVLLLTSKSEGSPNIIKEAMACGTPIVCTDVGDVRWLLSGLDNCYITNEDPKMIKEMMGKALSFNGKTQGPAQIKELGLESSAVAAQIISIYKKELEK
jgi:glycosyltransferase involved in cell wall biosynthesis